MSGIGLDGVPDSTASRPHAAALLAFKNSSGHHLSITRYQVGALCVEMTLGFAFLPSYMRWIGTDSGGKPHKFRGIAVSNLLSLLMIAIAVIAGVSLYQ